MGIAMLRSQAYPGTIRYYLVTEDGREELKCIAATDLNHAVAQLDEIGKFMRQSDWLAFPRLHQWR
jgi:hypothetical protein